MTLNANPAITQAMQSVLAAIPKAAADPTRPVYHFCPPALWMNDPNGTIYHNGYYHVFYQHNPYGDDWGHMHWGHARSQDLVHWEHLPIALAPSLELGEAHIFSGCARVNGQGEPLLFYTSVKSGPAAARPPNEQWAAIGDADWITWQKHPANPILALATHGGPPFDREWRDPFIFEEAGRTFMVVGGDYADTAGVALYEAEDAALAHWRYRGLAYEKPRSEILFFECPNFFKVDGQWVLLISPYKPVEYLVGSFDLTSLKFKPETTGVLDAGFGETPNYYATNILYDEQDRCIVLGWMRGFAKEHGWNGCLALPRILTIGPDGHPRQRPIPALEQLRDRHATFSDLNVADSSHVLKDVWGDTLEILATITLGDAQAVGLQVRCAADGQQAILIRYDGQILHVAGTEIPYTVTGTQLKLHVFLDKSVMEIFVDDGRTAMTRVIYPPDEDLGVAVFAEVGNAHVAQLDVWTIQEAIPSLEKFTISY